MTFNSFIESLNESKQYNFIGCKLKNIDVLKKSNKLIFNIELPYIYELNQLDYLSDSLITYFSNDNKYIVDFMISYNDISNLDSIDMNSYFNEVIRRKSDEDKKFLYYKEFEKRFEYKQFLIVCAEEEMYHAKQKDLIQELLLKYGFTFPVVFRSSNQVASVSKIKSEIDAKNEQTFKEMVKLQKERQIEESNNKVEKQVGDYKSYQKYNKKTDNQNIVHQKISEIPSSQNELSIYSATIKYPSFTVKGKIFSIESRVLENSTLFKMSISDGTDSIRVVRFYNQREEEFFSSLKSGDYVSVFGDAEYNTYDRDVILKAKKILKLAQSEKTSSRHDSEEQKRVELSVHTKMSVHDGISEIKEYVSKAKEFGHTAIALTDKYAAYAFPDFAHAVEKSDFKPIYGVEFAHIREDKLFVAKNTKNDDLHLDEAIYTVFDLETTGLSAKYDKIIEIAAVKIKNGQEIDRLELLINPEMNVSETTTNITSITDADLAGQPTIKDCIHQIYDFVKDTVLVAHNAMFDYRHLKRNFDDFNLDISDYKVIDTLAIARNKYNKLGAGKFYESALAKYGENKLLRSFNLKKLSKLFGVSLVQHHRAIYDTQATSEFFLGMLRDLREDGINNYNELNNLITEHSFKYEIPNYLNVIATNKVGLKNLYKLISASHTDYYFKVPRATTKLLEEFREGLLFGSSSFQGEIFECALRNLDEELDELIDLYDYIEVQPPSQYLHMVEDNIEPIRIIEETISYIISKAEAKGKKVVATGNVHHIEEVDVKYRDILIKTPMKGGVPHYLSRARNIPSNYFLTTDEMLKKFTFLGYEKAKEIVVTNTNLIADQVEKMDILSPELFTPRDGFFKDKGIPSIEEEVKRMVYERAHELYSDNLPTLVEKRIEKELTSIINNKFASIYYISHLLVKKSLDDGYLVGSRGSVGSSLVATLMDITEVNPLSPHYRCDACKFSSFKMTQAEKEEFGVSKHEEILQPNLDVVESGFDLVDNICPKCGEDLKKDGHDIPFETFLGFKGDKVPDIDLNFSGDYQSVAHNYVKEVFGEDKAFRAGTISTIAEKTAFGYVKGYVEKTGQELRNVEIERLAKKITGVKRTTGQHPGGIVVVPTYIDIEDVTPVQYPGGQTDNDWKTTHFDYHSFEANLLKLDILGHDDPSVIRYIMDYVESHPDEFPFNTAKDIPVDDPKIYELFNNTESINVKPEQIMANVASYAVPEFGTSFVRQMLEDTKPKSFGELVKISGLSHGTDVWLNNAKDLVGGTAENFGKIQFSETIGCRDDIMVYLIYQGLEPAKAFEIMEFVRRGKPTKMRDKWAEYAAHMNEKGVPSWYIWSCEQIKYMFPKAHATAYVLMAVRIAWFKIHKPILFYSAYFSTRVDQFDVAAMIGGPEKIFEAINVINAKQDSTVVDKDLLNTLTVALEMTQRGYSFRTVDIHKSDATKFLIEDNKYLRIPFIAIKSLGESVAIDIVEQRKEGEFVSIQDAKKRTKLNKTAILNLQNVDAFNDLPDSGDSKKAEEDSYNLFSM